MDKAFFLNEAHTYINSLFNEFELLKNESKILLDCFSNICNQENIPYYLGDGSLLGSIRDGSTIPWDPDYDVWVPYNYIEKLLACLATHLPSNYCVITNFNQKTSFFETKIAKKDCNYGYVHLDIFYLIGTPSTDKKRRAFNALLSKLLFRRMNCYSFKQQQKSFPFLLRVVRFLTFFYKYGNLSFKLTNRRLLRLCNKYNYDKSEYVIRVFHYTALFPKPKESLLVPFMGNNHPVPNNYSEILDIIYKDYRSYLPIQNRFFEFYNYIFNCPLVSDEIRYDHIDFTN